VDRFLAEASRVLKRNGRLCVVFAGGYSLHAIINKILPHALARRVLYFFLPGSEVSQGFRAYYHLGTQKQFAQSLKVHGFQVKDIRYSFGSRGYFTFFLPCYLAVLLLDRLIAGINYTNWAADFIFIADKQTLPAPFHSRNEVGHA
jgi:hypothetical protein